MVKVHKKRTGPGEVLMWFSVVLIIVGILLSMGSYIKGLSVTSIGMVFAGVGVVVAILARMIIK